VRLLLSLFFKCKYKERGTLCGVSFDTMAYMDTKKYLLLCYDLKLPLLGALLNYGTNTMLNNGTLSPPSSSIFNIGQ
jgi:hypothetical protein